MSLKDIMERARVRTLKRSLMEPQIHGQPEGYSLEEIASALGELQADIDDRKEEFGIK